MMKVLKLVVTEFKKDNTKGMEWYSSTESVLTLDLAFSSSTNDYLCTYHL